MREANADAAVHYFSAARALLTIGLGVLEELPRKVDFCRQRLSQVCASGAGLAWPACPLLAGFPGFCRQRRSQVGGRGSAQACGGAVGGRGGGGGGARPPGVLRDATRGATLLSCLGFALLCALRGLAAWALAFGGRPGLSGRPNPGP